ncbi:GSCOCG00003576001-RA-CDS [Cotesia congregata]|nr:GSCOCG00003576001-RA-CDS [Cotesia congregata]
MASESDKFFSKEIEYSEEILKDLFKVKIPLNWNELNRKEKSELVHQWARNAFPKVPESLITLTVGLTVDGDSGRSIDEEPEWLDREKFARGQKFAQENLFGVFFSILFALFGLYSFEEGLNPLIITGKSSEPYSAFKRYLSTGARFRNWYTSDLWTKGTSAYNDIRTVRRVHEIIRNKVTAMTEEETNKATKIKHPWSPTRNTLVEDFKSACPAASPGQCPFTMKVPGVNLKKMHQGEMAMTQGGFVGLVVLFPEALGIHGATDKDLEDYFYVWRCIGYLLGIEDEFNFCRGTCEEIKQRSRDYLDAWVKPNLRDLTLEWEHMMRVMIAGAENYAGPGSSFERSIFYFAELMDIDMPQFRSLLSYRDWISHYFLKFMVHYAMRFSAVRKFMNAKMNTVMDTALQFSNEKHVELQEKSSKLLASVRSNRITENIFTQYKIFELSFLFVLLISIYKFFITI